MRRLRHEAAPHVDRREVFQAVLRAGPWIVLASSLAACGLEVGGIGPMVGGDAGQSTAATDALVSTVDAVDPRSHASGGPAISDAGGGGPDAAGESGSGVQAGTGLVPVGGGGSPANAGDAGDDGAMLDDGGGSGGPGGSGGRHIEGGRGHG